MANYDVVDVRPNRLGEHDPANDGPTDALILDLEDPALTLETLSHLRTADADKPALLVASPREEWADVPQRVPAGVRILPFPLSRETLLESLGEVLGPPLTEPAAPAEPPAAAAAAA